MEERLQKYMARCGVNSRRKCEELIARGLVEVNGDIVREPGVKIDPMRDRVKVEGKNLTVERPAHYIHYKIRGVTTTVSDDLGRKTVMDCLPGFRERVFPVGRLDRESEGLLVLTNDGAMANYLTHPAYGISKTYRVVAEGRVPEDVLAALSDKGIRLGPVLIKPSRVELVRYDNDNTIVLISVAEGINREVRRIFAALGHEVKKLLRTQVGPLSLAGMKRGQTRPMTPKEIAVLAKGMAGLNPAEETELFPSGSAASRRPTGPRGRPKAAKAPRQGKPDPALARETRKRKVTVDDWEKKSSRTRPSDRAAPAKGKSAQTKVAVKPGKALKPASKSRKPAFGARTDSKSASASTPAPARTPRQRQEFAPKPRLASHPLAPKPARTARPERPERPERSGRQGKPETRAKASIRTSVRTKAGPGKPGRTERPSGSGRKTGGPGKGPGTRNAQGAKNMRNTKGKRRNG